MEYYIPGIQDVFIIYPSLPKNRRTNTVQGIFRFEAYYELQYPRVIWGSHRSAAKDSSLLGCYAVSSGGELPTFRSVMHLCSRSRSRRWRHPAPSKCQVFASGQDVKFQKPRISTVSIPFTAQRLQYCSQNLNTTSPPRRPDPYKFKDPSLSFHFVRPHNPERNFDVKFTLANYNLIVFNNYRNC